MDKKFKPYIQFRDRSPEDQEKVRQAQRRYGYSKYQKAKRQKQKNQDYEKNKSSDPKSNETLTLAFKEFLLKLEEGFIKKKNKAFKKSWEEKHGEKIIGKTMKYHGEEVPTPKAALKSASRAERKSKFGESRIYKIVEGLVKKRNKAFFRKKLEKAGKEIDYPDPGNYKKTKGRFVSLGRELLKDDPKEFKKAVKDK